MKRKLRGLRRGVAALCLGGGNAVAMAVERVSVFMFHQSCPFCSSQ